jgi:quercetin dioxygenase-like cupin family protein
MKISRSSQATNIGPDSSFTGNVYIDSIKDPDEQSAIGCAHVHFSPGARTVWHRHPKGQTLYVTDGVGYAQRRGGEIEILRSGDIVFIEPGEEHWHGAAADRFMAHIAMHEADASGSVVTWLQPVTNEEYNAAPNV